MYTIEMILDRLDRKLVANANIVPGDWISSVRFSEGNLLRNNILFLSALPDTGHTLCQTARGSVFEYHVDTKTFLNQVMEIMDYYDTWEAGLEQAIHGGSTLTELLDLAYPVIPFFMFILDNAQWMIANSSHLQHYNIQSNQDLTDLLSFHSSSTEKIASFNKEFYQCFQRKDVYKVPGKIFTDNGYAVNLFCENRFSGILLMEGFDNEITQGTLDLFFLFSWKIQNMINDPSSNLSISSKELSLLDYLNEPDDSNLTKLQHDLRIMGWNDTDEKLLIYLAPSAEAGLSPNMNHAMLIFNRLPVLKSAEYQDGILLLLNHTMYEMTQSYRQIKDQIRQLSYCAGTSGLFRDLSELPVMLLRSRAALLAGDRFPGTINDFNDHFMPYFFSTVKKEDRAILEHPILKKFEAYDKRYGSSLLQTLFMYLTNERRITETANAMNVSRNTVVHRLQRIEELSEGILDDPLVRLRILLSYYLREA